MSMIQDLRFAARALRRRPGFAALVTLTLALGLGANAAVYGLVHALLLAPIPVHRPQEVVAVFEALAPGAYFEGTSYPAFADYRRSTRSLAALAGFSSVDAGLVARGHAERISLGVVSGEYFSLLGLRPAAGRLLVPSDEAAPGSTPYVVLGHGLWRRAFGSDPSIVGTTIQLSGAPFTVVGIAPSGFRGTELQSAPEAWIPITMVQSVGAGGLFSQGVLETRFFQWVRMVGRLRPGATPATAERELNEVALRVRRELAERAPADTMSAPIRVAPITVGAAMESRADLLRFVTLLAVVAALTLAIACLNIANLLLARGVERARELGVRAALGAGRARLVRQLLAESMLLAVAGGLVGLAVAMGTFSLIRSFTLPGGIELSTLPLTVNPAVMSFALLAAMGTMLAFGVLPALRSTRGNVAERVVSAGSRVTTGSGRVSALLVSGQVALSLVLLTGASLLLRSVAIALRTDLGFDARGVAALSIGLREHGYDASRGRAFVDAVIEQTTRRPGIGPVALAYHVPIGGGALRLPMTIPGSATPNARASINPLYGEYFEALGIPLVAGRILAPSDHLEQAPRVAVINESAAQRLWPGENPLGKTATVFGRNTFTVVGVVGDSKYHRLDEAGVPYLFVSMMQFPREAVLGEISVVARANRSSGYALEALRSTIRELDPTLPIFDARLVADQIDRVLMPQRFGLRLLGAFGVLALLVSAVGIYGLVAYTVTQRTREIGIRLALGASRSNVLGVVARQTLVAAVGGLVVGVGAALAASRLLSTFLHGVTPSDPAAFMLATLVLVGAAALACLLPARRATRIEPVVALRSE